MINTSIHVRSRSFLENHTRFQTKMGKMFTDRKGPKPLPFPYIKEYPPDPVPFHDCQRPRQGLKMGEENSILIRLMIQRTVRHTSTKNLLGVFTTLTHVSCYLAIFCSYFSLPRTNQHRFYQSSPQSVFYSQSSTARSPCFIPSPYFIPSPQSVVKQPSFTYTSFI